MTSFNLRMKNLLSRLKVLLKMNIFTFLLNRDSIVRHRRSSVMGEMVIKHLATEKVNNKHYYLEKAFSIDGKEVTGAVDSLSLNPLRFLEHALIQKEIKIKKLIDGNDPWNIEELRIEYNNYEEIEKLLKEIMEYRCHPEYDLKWKHIIRQLPYEVLMKTSDAIMNYGKNPEDIAIDKLRSDRRWREIADHVRSEYGESYAIDYENGNPNGTIDELTISKDEPQKRRHLIYKSARGGYNIKTLTYEDSSLDCYCYSDSRIWD